jgi:hypothetical protein
MDFVRAYFRLPANKANIKKFRDLLAGDQNLFPKVLDRFRMNVGFIIKQRTRPYVVINFQNLMKLKMNLFQVLFSESHLLEERDGDDFIYFTYFLSSTEEPFNDQRMFFYEQNKDRFQQVQEVPGLFSSQLTYLTNVAYYTAAATGDYFALYRVGQNILTPLNELTETEWYQFFATQFLTVPVYNNSGTTKVFFPPSSTDYVSSVGNWRFNIPLGNQDTDTAFGLSTIEIPSASLTMDLYLVKTPQGLQMTLAFVGASLTRDNAYNVAFPKIGQLIAAVNNKNVISNFTNTGLREGSTATTVLSSVSQVTTDSMSWLSSIVSKYNYNFNVGTAPYLSTYPCLVPTAVMKKATTEFPLDTFYGYMQAMSCDYSNVFRHYDLDRRCVPNQYSFELLRKIFNGPQTFESGTSLIRTGIGNMCQYLQPERIRNYLRMEIYPFDLTQESEFVKLRVQGVDQVVINSFYFDNDRIIFYTNVNSVPNPNPDLPPVFPTAAVAKIDLGLATSRFFSSSSAPTYAYNLPLKDWDQIDIKGKEVNTSMEYSGIRTYDSMMEMQVLPQYRNPNNYMTRRTWLLQKCILGGIPEGQLPPQFFTFTNITYVPNSQTQSLQGVLLDFTLALAGDFPSQLHSRFDDLLCANAAYAPSATYFPTSPIVVLYYEPIAQSGNFQRIGQTVAGVDFITYQQISAMRFQFAPFAGYFRYFIAYLPTSNFYVNVTVPVRISFISDAINPFVQLYHAYSKTFERRITFNDIANSRDEILHFRGLFFWDLRITLELRMYARITAPSNARGALYARSANNPIALYSDTNVHTFNVPTFLSGPNFGYGESSFANFEVKNGIIIGINPIVTNGPYTAPQYRANIELEFSQRGFLGVVIPNLNDPWFMRSTRFEPDDPDLNAFRSVGFLGNVKGPLDSGEIAAWLTSFSIPKNDGKRWSILIPLMDAVNFDTLVYKLVLQQRYCTGYIAYSDRLVENVNSLYQFAAQEPLPTSRIQIVSFEPDNFNAQRYLRYTFVNEGIFYVPPVGDFCVKFELREPWTGTIPTTCAWFAEEQEGVNPQPLRLYPQLTPIAIFSASLLDDRVQVTTGNIYSLMKPVNYTIVTTFKVTVNEFTNFEFPPSTPASWALESWIDGVSIIPVVLKTGVVGTALFGSVTSTPLTFDVTGLVIPPTHTFVRFVIYVATSDYGQLRGTSATANGSGDIILNCELNQAVSQTVYAGLWRDDSYIGKAFSIRDKIKEWPYMLRIKRSQLTDDLIVSYAVVDQSESNVPPYENSKQLLWEATDGLWTYDKGEYYLQVDYVPGNPLTGLRILISCVAQNPPVSSTLRVLYTSTDVTTDPTNTIYSFNSTPTYLTLPLSEEEMIFWGEIYLRNPTSIQFFIELNLALVGGRRDYIWSQYSEFTAIAMKEGDHSNASTMMVLTDNAENYGYQSSYYSILYSQVEGNQRFFWQKFLQRPTALFLTTMTPIKLLNYNIWDYKLKRNLILFFR